jgi:hypothetical protein
MVDPSSLRVADADREQVASELREHLVAGRLKPEEFEERVESAYRASTRAELDRVKEDLPMSPTAVAAELSSRRARIRRRLIRESSGGLTASAICVGIWVADGASGGFWPGWVIAFTLLPAARNAWRLFGRNPDVEAVEADLARRRRRRIERDRRHSSRHSGPRELDG